jgi:hypothetical protein
LKNSSVNEPSRTVKKLQGLTGDSVIPSTPFWGVTVDGTLPADTFNLTLRALPHWPTRFSARLPEHRLRAALKRLLRDHSLRCDSAKSPSLNRFRLDIRHNPFWRGLGQTAGSERELHSRILVEFRRKPETAGNPAK